MNNAVCVFLLALVVCVANSGLSFAEDVATAGGTSFRQWGEWGNINAVFVAPKIVPIGATPNAISPENNHLTVIVNTQNIKSSNDTPSPLPPDIKPSNVAPSPLPPVLPSVTMQGGPIPPGTSFNANGIMNSQDPKAGAFFGSASSIGGSIPPGTWGGAMRP